MMAARFAAGAGARRNSIADLDPRLLMVSLVGLTLFPAAGAPIWRRLFHADDLDFDSAAPAHACACWTAAWIWTVSHEDDAHPRSQRHPGHACRSYWPRAATTAPQALGTLEWDRISLPAPAAEKIVRIDVREGQRVAAGARLMQLELDPHPVATGRGCRPRRSRPATRWRNSKPARAASRSPRRAPRVAAAQAQAADARALLQPPATARPPAAGGGVRRRPRTRRRRRRRKRPGARRPGRRCWSSNAARASSRSRRVAPRMAAAQAQAAVQSVTLAEARRRRAARTASSTACRTGSATRRPWARRSR